MKLEGRYQLLKEVDGELKFIEEGFVTPSPIREGESVVVGNSVWDSGWITSVVLSVEYLGREVRFKTLNSSYVLKPINNA